VSDDFEFSPTTPLYHPDIDGWGLSIGTRVWMADGGFKPVQDIEEGDEVFGRGYQIETDYVERNPNAVDPTENLMKVWRPVLVSRTVLGKEKTEARAWEMTFGHDKKQYEARRLVAGGETTVRLFPDAHDHREAKPMVACHTALDNPRVGSETRKAMKLDPEASQRAKEPRYQQTALTGTPRGEQVVIVPYEAMGGQMEMIDTEQKDYNRYIFSQVREVVPVPGMEKATLYQLHLQPDTTEDLGVLPDHEPRCNAIVQTPFAGESEVREVKSDPKSGQRIQRLNSEIESGEGDLRQRWNDYAQEMSSPEGSESKHTTYRQGQFHDTKSGKKGEALSKHYNIEDGWLNGGLLVNLPVPEEYEKPDSDVVTEEPFGEENVDAATLGRSPGETPPGGSSPGESPSEEDGPPTARPA